VNVKGKSVVWAVSCQSVLESTVTRAKYIGQGTQEREERSTGSTYSSLHPRIKHILGCE